MKRDLDVRDAEIVARHQRGETLQGIAQRFDLSRERIRQIVLEMDNGWQRGAAAKPPSKRRVKGLRSQGVPRRVLDLLRSGPVSADHLPLGSRVERLLGLPPNGCNVAGPVLTELEDQGFVELERLDGGFRRGRALTVRITSRGRAAIQRLQEEEVREACGLSPDAQSHTARRGIRSAPRTHTLDHPNDTFDDPKEGSA